MKKTIYNWKILIKLKIMKKIAQPWEMKIPIVLDRPDLTQKAAVDTRIFCTMIETVLMGNERWSLDHIISDWWYMFISKIRNEQWELYHEILFIKAFLYHNGYKNLKLLLPKKFVEIYKIINEKQFNHKSIEQIDLLDTQISKYTGHKLTLLTEE